MTTHPLRRWWPLLGVTALLLVVAAVLAFVPNWTETVAGRPTCLPKVDVSARENVEMEGAADQFRADRRVAMVTTETKEAGYARFKELFADRPDVVAAVPPDQFPAVAHVVLVSGTDPKLFVDEMAKRIPLQFQRPRCF